MWQVDEKLQGYLRAAHQLAADMLNWAWTNRDPGGDVGILAGQACNAPGGLGRVADETHLHLHMGLLAASPHLGEIRRDYFRITRDYRSFVESGARLELTGDGLDTAKVVFRYLYDHLLDSETFWDEYDRSKPIGFDKTAYREAFKKGREVCPFCDYNTVTVVATSEHFLTEASCPVTAAFWLNLVVACSDCNSGSRLQKVVGTMQHGSVGSNVPIFHPFFHQVADHIRIPFDQKHRPLPPVPTARRASDRIRAQNFCNVYETAVRYGGDTNDREALHMFDLFKDRVERAFELATTTRPRTRELLRQVMNDQVEALKGGLRLSAGRLPKVKFLIDLLTHLQEQVEQVGTELGLP